METNEFMRPISKCPFILFALVLLCGIAFGQRGGGGGTNPVQDPPASLTNSYSTNSGYAASTLYATNAGAGPFISYTNGIGTNLTINGYLKVNGDGCITTNFGNTASSMLIHSTGASSVAALEFRSANGGSAQVSAFISLLQANGQFTATPMWTVRDGAGQGTGALIFEALSTKVMAHRPFSATNTVTFGQIGTVISNVVSATASLDFPNILAASSADLPIAVTGAKANDTVELGSPAGESASLITKGFVASNGWVTVRAYNIGAIAVDQAALTYRVNVTEH